MENSKSFYNSELPKDKVARREFKAAERQYQKLGDKQDFFIKSFVARKLYGFERFRSLAQKIAPAEITRIKYKEAADEFDLVSRLREAFEAPIPEKLKQNPIVLRTPDVNTPKLEPKEQITQLIPQKIEETVVLEPIKFVEGIGVETGVVDKSENRTKEEEKHVTFDWKKWIEENKNKEENIEEENKENQPFIFFDEEKKKVSRFSRSVTNRSHNILVSLNNSDLEEFVDEQIDRIKYEHARDDMKRIISYVIENPNGRHAKFMSQAALGVREKVYRLKRVDPGKILGFSFKNKTTRDLRIIFAMDGDHIIFREILKHTEMDQKYK